MESPLSHKITKSWREAQGAYRNIPRAFRLVIEADKRGSSLMFLLIVVSAIFPITQAWIAKLIIDTVTSAVTTRVSTAEGLQLILPYLLLEFGVLAASLAITQIRRVIEPMVNARITHHINKTLMQKSLALDYQYFEDDVFYNQLQNARSNAYQRSLEVVNGCYMLVQSTIMLLTFMIGLSTFNPLIILIIFGATIPSFLTQNKYSRLSFRMHNWRAPEVRQMQYIEHILTIDSSAKEIRLFDLGDPLLKRYAAIFWRTFTEDYQLARRRSLVGLLWGLMSLLSYYGAYLWLALAAITGRITLGSMVLYLTLFRQTQSSFQGWLDSINRLYENGLFIGNLFQFLNLPPLMAHSEQPVQFPESIAQGIEFSHVWFRYPQRAGWALREINLAIAPGEKIALVGPNGAGKTTLIKLLTRLYDPTEGQILLDGVDLREYDLKELRLRIGVIFQDFVMYQTTMRENIGFGQIDALEDTARILHAAQRGGASETIAELPDGVETMLGNWFEHGQQLSGGQWQKVALSRAFMRDSDILVLDEPTAALDAEHEYEIFQRFRDLTHEKIAIIISHRFSTVRMADTIVVIEDGTICEQGSHDALIAQAGTYARLFHLQAEGYR